MELMNYDQKETYVEKVFQIAETLEIRIGIMIVGKSGTGKTSIYQIIQKAYCELSPLKLPRYSSLEVTKINPKAVNTNGLYGYVNALTNEWHDGIVSKIIRNASVE
jgi:dynein heavy chain, axonemal